MSGKTKNLLLIYPRSFAVSYGDMRFVSHLTGKAGLLNVALATIAALVPDGFQVTIRDEHYDTIDYDGQWDLVGLTGFHTQIMQAEVIARKFRARGVPVVSGGPSVSVSPQRWRDFSDVLVVGEAERIWPRFCSDFLAGSYADTYLEEERFGIETSPLPDYSGFSRATINRYFGGIVQTSRGCPFDCEFCDVIAYVGRVMRYKAPAQVLAEVRQQQKLGLKFVVFADDNFSAGRKQATAILATVGAYNRSLRAPLNFATQASIDCAQDGSLLKLASESGLNRILVGIESPNVESLKEANKLQNVRSDMVRDVIRFHQHGIMVMGTSIVGFDHDETDIFRRHLDFFNETGILSPQPFPLQAPDGTPLRVRAEREGRYRGWETSLPPEQANNFNTFTLTPARISVDQLRDGLYWLIRELYRPDHVLLRLERFFGQFDQSPYRSSLDIPGAALDRQSLAIVGRLASYLLLRGSREERRLLKEMVAVARRSKHPQKFALAITVFLQSMNTRLMLQRLAPQASLLRPPD